MFEMQGIRMMHCTIWTEGVREIVSAQDLAQATGSCIVADSVFRWRELKAAVGRSIQRADQLWAEAVARYRDGAIWWLDEPELVVSAKAEQEQRYHADAWDDHIDRWLAFEQRRVNHGYGSYDDWRDEEVERTSPLTDVSVGEILESALGVEPGRWAKADQMRVGAYLRTRQREDIKGAAEPFGNGDIADRRMTNAAAKPS